MAPVTAAAPDSSRSDMNAGSNGDHGMPQVTGSLVSTAPAKLQAPVTSAPDTTWGIPTPIFSGMVGATIGFCGAAVLFKIGRRNTQEDREEDRQRDDALRERIEARELWSDLYEDIRTAASDTLALCIDLSERPLCQDDAEAQHVAALHRRLRIAIGHARGHRSPELTESLTELCTRLEELRRTLLPQRTALTDRTQIDQHNVLDIAAQSADQARIGIALEGNARKTRDALDTEWGSR
nr:hypothetical protein [Streptomyces sp. S1D4-11]